MKDWRRWCVRIAVAGLLCVMAWQVSRPADDGYNSIQGEAFATHYRITYADGPGAAELKRAIDLELARIDAMASTWRDDSELMRYNHADNPQAFELSPQLSWLIEQAKQIQTQTNGAFSLRPDGGAMDLSGIAKGYAVDRVVELLQREFKITHCLVDIGGEVRAVGNGPGGDGWRVGLYQPTDATNRDVPMLQLRDTSVATSGTYFRGPHIIDPSTGKPVANDLLSASVIHPSNTTADALATALYVMGPDRGLQWARENNIHAILILKDGRRRETPAAE